MPTVAQWVNKLEDKIEKQTRYAKPWEDRYENKYCLPFIAKEYLDVYGPRAEGNVASILEAPRTGSAGITVDALVERLTVLGGDSDDKATAKAMKEAWDDNQLQVMSHEAHREAILRSTSLGVVSRSTDGRAIGTIESSEQAAVHRMAGPPYDVDGYFKRWIDEWTGKWHATAQLPGFDVDLVKSDSPGPDPEGSDVTARWDIVGEKRSRTTPVPVVEFAHRSRLLKDPMSEIEPIYSIVDLADLIEGLMVFAGHFGAVPIRWGTGLDVPRDPKDPTKPLMGGDGKPAMGFKPRSDQFWFNSNPEGKFGQLVPATLDTYVVWANWARGLLRSNTKVASTYYALDLKSHMTAELLKTDESPMVRRVKNMGMNGSFNQSWARFQTLMMQVEGQKGRVRPIWEDPQTRMEAASVDAFQKAVASGVGVVFAAQKFLGWTREEAEAAHQEAVDEVARQADAAGVDPLTFLDPKTRARLKLVTGADPDAPASA